MTQRIDDSAFAAVQAGSLLANACSPAFGYDELAARGIRIHAPAEVQFTPGEHEHGSGAFAHFVVCGACHFDANYLGLDSEVLERLLFVAQAVGDHRVYAGTMEVVPNRIPRQRRRVPLTDADYAGRSIIQYFNPNLITVLGLPERPAVYLVHVALGTYVSNVVRVALREATREEPR